MRKDAGQYLPFWRYNAHFGCGTITTGPFTRVVAVAPVDVDS